VDEDNLLIRRVEEDTSASQIREARGGGDTGLIVSMHACELWTCDEKESVTQMNK